MWHFLVIFLQSQLRLTQLEGIFFFISEVLFQAQVDESTSNRATTYSLPKPNISHVCYVPTAFGF